MKTKKLKLLLKGIFFLLITSCAQEETSLLTGSKNPYSPPSGWGGAGNLNLGDGKVHIVALTPVNGKMKDFITNSGSIDIQPINHLNTPNQGLATNKDINALYINADNMSVEQFNEFMNSGFVQNMYENRTAILVDTNPGNKDYTKIKKLTNALGFGSFDVGSAVLKSQEKDKGMSIPIFDLDRVKQDPAYTNNSLLNVMGFIGEDSPEQQDEKSEASVQSSSFSTKENPSINPTNFCGKICQNRREKVRMDKIYGINPKINNRTVGEVIAYASCNLGSGTSRDMYSSCPGYSYIPANGRPPQEYDIEIGRWGYFSAKKYKSVKYIADNNDYANFHRADVQYDPFLIHPAIGGIKLHVNQSLSGIIAAGNNFTVGNATTIGDSFSLGGSTKLDIEPSKYFAGIFNRLFSSSVFKAFSPQVDLQYTVSRSKSYITSTTISFPSCYGGYVREGKYVMGNVSLNFGAGFAYNNYAFDGHIEAIIDDPMLPPTDKIWYNELNQSNFKTYSRDMGVFIGNPYIGGSFLYAETLYSQNNPNINAVNIDYTQVCRVADPRSGDRNPPVIIVTPPKPPVVIVTPPKPPVVIVIKPNTTSSNN